MRENPGVRYALVLAFSVVMLYGPTYQQFRFFTLDKPGGATDALHYVQMARDAVEPDTPNLYHYRWVTPAAANFIRPAIDSMLPDKDLAELLSFYLVNFAFSVSTCLILFALLQELGYGILVSLLGVAAFASSRTTVLVTATPMVDAVYFCAVATVLYLTVARRALLLALLLPVLILSKETIIPFLLLPLLTEMRRSWAYWAGLACASLALFVSGRAIDAALATSGPTFFDFVSEHRDDLRQSFARVITAGGLQDLQSGFSLLIPLSVIGAWLNARHRYHSIPRVLVATVPIALGLALLSGNMGRMFFAAFPAVIAYALIPIEHVARLSRSDKVLPTPT